MHVLYTIFIVYLAAYIYFEIKKRSVFFFEMRTILSASILTVVLAEIFYSRHCLDTNILNQSGSILGHSSLDTPLKLYRNRFFLFMFPFYSFLRTSVSQHLLLNDASFYLQFTRSQIRYKEAVPASDLDLK